MSNADFFDLVFEDYWSKIDRGNLVEDPHSMFGDAEVFRWLIEKVRPETIIEVGSWKGHSANFMADCCREFGLSTKIVCVDTFLGAVEHWVMPGSLPELYIKNGRPTVLERFQGNTLARGNEGHVFPFVIDSANAAQVFSHFNFKADLIFVDAAHDYDDVIADIQNYYPLLADNGVIFGDDYQYEPLRNAVHEMSSQLGLPVIVSQRKWMLLNQGLISHVFPIGYHMRKSGEGWIHP